jgi:hypothetical protein
MLNFLKYFRPQKIEEKLGYFDSHYTPIQAAKQDHILITKKRHFFRLKWAEISLNSDHRIDPTFSTLIYFCSCDQFSEKV